MAPLGGQSTASEDINKKFVQRAFVKSLSSEFQRTAEEDTKLHISEIYQWLSEDEQRNIEIVNDVIIALKALWRSMPVEFIEHLMTKMKFAFLIMWKLRYQC